MNRTALDHGFGVVATGHNLDDEAATLLGSTLHWDESSLARQTPVLEATHPKLARRVKPLFRLSERETAAYAFLRGIDYIVEVPVRAGRRRSPTAGLNSSRTLARRQGELLLGFLERARPRFQAGESVDLRECVRCGQTTTGEVCAFCKLADQVKRAAPRSAVGSPVVEPTDPAALRGLAADLDGASGIHAS
jgi:tRNA(Ile)-lysidine synthase TilS/MesJ